jgi:pyrimidine-nucleoside phosphorylase
LRAYDIIRKKRDGGRLTGKETSWFIKAYTRGAIPDYQASAWLMAVYLQGMDRRETLALTDAMLRSGTVLDLSGIPGPKVDKHSTGGVGDKVSLILAPLVASAGAIVPMLAGRGLGHTGGTLDKLGSISGFDTGLDKARFIELLKSTGTAITGQTAEIAPADRRLYALRDVTATVECIPLIAASIMSKKLAEGIDALVLDVKTGCGAFMKSYDDAVLLAETLVMIAKGAGKKVSAVVTDMDQPLGRCVGNSLEVKEAVLALKGLGPSDLMEVTLELGSRMLVITGIEPDIKKAGLRLAGLIKDGSAFRKFCEMVSAQGGDVRMVMEPSRLPDSREQHGLKAKAGGIVQHINAEDVGLAAMMLGAGREKAEDSVDPAAGVMLIKKAGDTVRKGDLLAVMHVTDNGRLKEARGLLEAAYTIGDKPPPKRPLIYKIIE